MKLPTLLKLSLSWLTKIPGSTLQGLFSTVATEAASLVTNSTLEGKEKALAVLAKVLPLVPDQYEAIAGAVARILIEIWYLIHKAK